MTVTKVRVYVVPEKGEEIDKEVIKEVESVRRKIRTIKKLLEENEGDEAVKVVAKRYGVITIDNSRTISNT